MSRLPLSRRSFLVWLGGIFALGPVPVRSATALRLEAGATALAALVPDRCAARAIARAACIEHRRCDVPVLVRRLLAGLEVAPTAAPELLARALRERIQRDFAREDTLRVSGWTLSRTEVQLAALAAALA